MQRLLKSFDFVLLSSVSNISLGIYLFSGDGGNSKVLEVAIPFLSPEILAFIFVLAGIAPNVGMQINVIPHRNIQVMVGILPTVIFFILSIFSSLAYGYWMFTYYLFFYILALIVIASNNLNGDSGY